MAGLHTLEISLAVIIMFGVVASTIPLMAPAPTPDRIEETITQRLQDQLHIWDEGLIPALQPCDAPTKLERLVREGLAGDHARWEEDVDRMFGPALDMDLVLDNYRANLPIHGTGRVRGMTGIINWMPEMTYSYPLTAVNAASGTERLRIDVPAIHQGALAASKGDAVRYGIRYTSAFGDAERTTWGLTAHLGDAARQGSDLFWVEGNGANPALVYGVREVETAGTEKSKIYLRIQAAPGTVSSSDVVPGGTIVNVTLPAGWGSAGWHTETLGGWVNISPPMTEGAPVHLVAQAGDPAGVPSKTLQIDAFPPSDPVRPFDVATARLSIGSMATSDLVLQYPVTTLDRSAPRLLAATTPYAVRGGQEAFFGVALANGGDDITVTSVNIKIPGGYDLWHHNGDGVPMFAVEPPSASKPATGWTRKSAREWEWNAGPNADPVPIEALKADDFWIKLKIATYEEPIPPPPHAPKLLGPTALQPATGDGPNATVAFANGHSETGWRWGKSPGVPSFLVPAASRGDDHPSGASSDGYSWSGDALLLGSSRSIDATSRGTKANLENTTSYVLRPGAADPVNLENAATNASFEVKTRKAPLGSRLVAEGDLSSLVETLQQLNVEGTLTLEMYSPPSLGCKPTAKWEIDVRSLPTPKILHTHIALAGTPPAPSVFATTEDGYLYRLSPTGAPVWVTKLAGSAAAIEEMDLGLDGRYLLVGTTTGKAQAVNMDDGTIRWTSTILAGPGTAQPFAATSIRHDTLHARVLATAGRDIVALSVTNGNELDGRAFPDLALDAIPTEQGVLVLRTSGTYLLDDEDMDVELTADNFPATAIHATPTKLILVEPTRARILDPVTFASAAATIDFALQAERVARGDATGDGVADAVVALADHSLVVIDGATGTVAWTEGPAYATVPIAPIDPFRYDIDNTPPPSVSTCTPLDSPPGYTTPYTCGGADAGSDLPALAAGGARAGLAKRTGNSALIAQSSATPVGWDDLRDDGDPSALSIGAWLTNTHATAYGNKHGKIVLYDDLGEVIFTSEPSERAGRFSFQMIVPEGGFYGTHLLVARLQWETGGIPQEARLLDWFEVVDHDGTPMPFPAYRLVLTADRLEAPYS